MRGWQGSAVLVWRQAGGWVVWLVGEEGGETDGETDTEGALCIVLACGSKKCSLLSVADQSGHGFSRRRAASVCEALRDGAGLRGGALIMWLVLAQLDEDPP